MTKYAVKNKKNDPSNIRVRNVCCFFLRVGPVYPPMMFQRRFGNWGMQKTNDFNETIFHEKTKCARSSRFGLGFRGKHFLVHARIILNMVDKKCELCSWNYFCLLGERGKGNYSTACGVPTQTRCLVWARCWFDAGIRGAKQLFEQSARKLFKKNFQYFSAFSKAFLKNLDFLKIRTKITTFPNCRTPVVHQGLVEQTS